VEPWGREAIFNGPEMDAALVEVGEHLGGEGKAPADAVELSADEGVAGLENFREHVIEHGAVIALA
jgi:hypothetical protein